MFRWGASEELLSVQVYQGLKAVAGLRGAGACGVFAKPSQFGQCLKHSSTQPGLTCPPR